jgi:hypothetical protein
MMIYGVVLIELALAIAATSLAWICRSSKRLFACGVLAGMAWCSFIHGFCFGVLRVEGTPAGPADDWGMLVGFGVISAVIPGVLLGLIVGTLAVAGRQRYERRVALREQA